MKFIVHNLRMIRARLRSNGWVFAELFLVFIVMWFLCDSCSIRSIARWGITSTMCTSFQ